MTYKRIDTEWLYLYYSGEKLSIIGEKLHVCGPAIRSRVAYMKLPQRPKGNFSPRVKGLWLKEPHIIALRRLFKNDI